MLTTLTFCNDIPNSFCNSLGVRNKRTTVVSLTNGITLINISTAINMEQIGSAIFKSNVCMRNVEMMTPTLPSVSAKTCRNTPGIKEKDG